MPVMHLTLHGYATWMPDRKQGSHHYRRGYQAPSEQLDHVYRTNQREPSASLTHTVPHVLIDQFIVGGNFPHYEPIALAFEDTHVHLVLAWRDDRPAEKLRDRLKHALSQRLNADVEQRTWFSRGGICRPVRGRGYLDHLRREYLPGHGGPRWDRADGEADVNQRHAVPRLSASSAAPTHPTHEDVVHGLDLDAESRCRHWHADHDVAAMFFPCCRRWYACHDCHAALADHPPVRLAADAPAAARCGACGHTMSAQAYLDAGDRCPACGHPFNPGCRLHRHLYFAHVTTSAAARAP